MNKVKLVEGVQTNKEIEMGMIFRRGADGELYLLTGINNCNTYLLHSLATGNCWNSDKNYRGKTVEEMREQGFNLISSGKIEITIR